MLEKHELTLHPEKLAQLYVSAFINGDPASLLQLSSTLTDKESLAKDQSYMRSMAERVAFRAAMGNLIDFTSTAITRTPTLSQDLQKQLIPFAQAQARAILKTGCRVSESKVLEACSAGQPRTVEVYLSCLVPDIPSWKPDAAALPSLPRTYFSALSSTWEGPAIKPLSVKIRLYSTEQDDDWELDSSHDPRGIIAAISASLSPDTRPANRNKHIPGATYMTLNTCIYRSSSDFNNSYVLLSDDFWRFAKTTDLEQVLARYGDALLLVYDSNTTAFHVALKNKASLAVMQALRKQLPHMPGFSGYRSSLLTEAIKAHNSAQTIKWLIDEGALVDEFRESYMRPLIYAVMEGADAQTIDLLVAAGADLSYYNSTNYPDLDALRAAMRTESLDARRAIARHLLLPESGSDLMQYLLTQLSYGVNYTPKYPDATSDILPILIERGMSLDETFCNTFKRHVCEPEQRSNLMDVAVHIGNPKLIDFFAKKGIKPHYN